MKKISLYIHIPFCRSKCKYCKFASFGNIKKVEIEKYIDFLCKEIFSIKEKYILTTIYFGGGTPSILDEKMFEKIFISLKQKFVFDENIEITLESNPEDIEEDRLKLWSNMGINRINIGVQTMNKKSLQKIGREDKGDIMNSLQIINNSGFKDKFSFGLDFIIGLPFVGLGEVANDIKTLIESFDFIKHISVYTLEGTITNYPKEWIKISISEENYWEEYINVKNILEKNGFCRYEISNYSKSGYESIHNKGYWEHKEYLGIGLGAHSFINNYRYQNSNNTEKYYRGEKDNFEKLTSGDIFLEKLLFGFRTSGIPYEYTNKLNINKINEYIKDGYFAVQNNNIIIEEKGVMLIDYLLKDIII